MILTNTKLPTTATTNSDVPTIAVMQPSTTLTNDAPVLSVFNQSTLVSSHVTTTSITNCYLLTLNNISKVPTIINSATTNYVPAQDPSNPQIGEFVYTGNGQIIIYSTEQLTQVTFPNYNFVKSTTIPLVNGLDGIPIVGEVNITESFQDHPSASMQLVCPIIYANILRSRFPVGSLYIIDRFSFIVQSYNEDLHMLDDLASVSISFKGKWFYYANKPLPLVINVTPTTAAFLDPDCAVGATNASTASVTYITLQELAGRNGITIGYIPIGSIPGRQVRIKIDKTNINATTTINTELNKVVDIKASFIDYSNPNAIDLKILNNTTNWTFTDYDLISNFTTTINRLPVVIQQSNNGIINNYINYNSVPPSTITSSSYFINSENSSLIPTPTIYNFITADNFSDTGLDLNTEITNDLNLNNPNTQQYSQPVRKEFDTGDPDPTVPPTSVTKLTSLDMNFDRSGATKTTIHKIEEDGFPVQEITRRYGFAYTAWNITTFEFNGQANVPVLNFSSPTTYWTLIEENIKTYIYDDNTGYLLGYDLTGRKLCRLVVEGDDNYTQNYQLALNNGETPSATQTLTYNNYSFRYVPVYGAKRYLLAQHRDYYLQFQNQEKFIKVCNRDGTSSYQINPAYIEPMFVIAEAEEYSCFLTGDNPKNLQRDINLVPPEPIYPQLSVGQETFNRSFITIFPSKNSNTQVFGNGLEGLFSSEYQGEDRYATYTSNFTAQDPSFASVTETTSDSESSGIPPVQTRKPVLTLIQPTKETNIVQQPFRYVFWTEPYNGFYPRMGSYSFPSAINITEVNNAINNQFKIDDIRNTLTSNCTVLYNSNIKAGDTATIVANGIVCKRRILGVTHNIKIDGLDINFVPHMSSGGTSLTMGIERTVQINSKREKIVTATSNNTLIKVVSDLYQLGSLLDDTNFTRRGN